MKRLLAVAVLACCPMTAQSDIAAALNFEQLRAKAKESVDVSLDSNTLQLAGRFLSGKTSEEKAKKLLESGLKAIFVRSFEFERDGEYTDADLNPVRTLLKAPGWTRIVGVNEKAQGESSEVWARSENGRPAGLCVIAAEKRELTVVYLDGPIKIDDLAALGGSFGIPAAKGTK
jgi:hypothetical protein